MMDRKHANGLGLAAWLAVVSTVLFPYCILLAADKSGVSPSVISLPKGPGSIAGLGEAYQASLNSGTGKYAVKIALPPGTAGNTPELALTYDGGDGNSSLGMGWSCPGAYVQRQTEKGIPRYVDGPNGVDDDFDGAVDNPEEIDRFISESREELVPVVQGANTYFFCKNESAFIRYERVGDHWEGRLPTGSRLIFGESANGRISDPAQPSHIFRWLLEKQIDTHGNTIRYRYTSFPGANNVAQRYLAAVEYGAGAADWGGRFHFAAFDYEDRTDWFEDCRSGFPIRTGKRLKTIAVGTQGLPLPQHLAGDFNADGTTDALNRLYRLTYRAATPVTLLESVTQLGMDGATTLPPSTYGYTTCQEPENVSAAGSLITSMRDPSSAFDLGTVDFIDLNGDGLPDLLKAVGSGTAHQVYFNQGETTLPGGDKSIKWSLPAEVEEPASGPSPWNLSLANQEAVLADVDGDGVADLVQMTPFDTYYFRSLQVTGGLPKWGTRTPLSSTDIVPPSPFAAGGDVRSIDLNFDKRTDIIRSTSVGGDLAYQVWFNLSDDTYSQRTTFSPHTGYDLSNPSVQSADLNGDRLTDIAWIRPSQILFTASYGRGNFGPEQAITIPGLTLSSEEIAKASLRDVNGDGLADLVVDRAEPQTIWIWPNRGNGTFGLRMRVTGLPSSASTNAVRWVDINGNGTMDIVFADSSAPEGERITALDLGELLECVPHPWLLKTITNGIGRLEELEYTTSTEFAVADGTVAGEYQYAWPDPLPFPVQVLKEVRTSDGMGNTYTTRFSYHNGYYDPVEKQFRGFARVEQKDVGDATAPTLISTFYFDTGRSDEARKGRMLRQIKATDGGAVFTDDLTQWRTRQLYAGTDGRMVSFASMQFTASDILELGAGTAQRIETETDFDSYGNQIEKVEYGRVINNDRMAGDDQRRTVTQFANNTVEWLVRFPKRVEVSPVGGAVFSRKDLFYDDESFGGGNFGTVTVGNQTMTREWPQASQAGQFITTSRSHFDAFGNPVTLFDPLYGSQPGHSREISYDPNFHAYPETETIHIGGGSADLVFNAAYDYGLGVMTSATEFNSNQTRFGYDPFARLTSLVKPGDSDVAPTEQYSYILGQSISGGRILNWIETNKRETAGGSTFDCRCFIDGLGRQLMTRCEGETSGQIVVSGVTKFNARRLPWKTYLPYFENASLDFADIPAAPPEYTATNYDSLNRVVETINPPETLGGSRKSSRIVFLPLEAVLFDEEDNDPGSPHFGTPHVQYKDGLDRLRGVDELAKLTDAGQPGALATWPTRYRYDLNDQLTGITDSQNNAKSMLYDGLKRMTFMDDPDRGVMNYTYDDASNLTDTIDAKSQHIVMTYDGANRIKTEDYLDVAGHSPDVTYNYDTPATVPAGDGSNATSAQVKGKLGSVTDLSGAEILSYDSRGRTAWKIKRVPDPRTGILSSYKSGFTYDSLDRLTDLAYPDGDNVGYGYNARNLPQNITGGPGGNIISGMAYKASGQLDTTTYGNGVATSYQYDPRLRLRSLLTQQSTLNNQLISFSYQFDGVSNITRIDDNRAAIPGSDPRKNTQAFGYDDLYRLTNVQYPALLSGSAGSISYAYDRIGNLLSQTSNIIATENGLPLTNLGTMSYGGTMGPTGRIGRNGGQPGPHALTAVSGGSRSYPYDSNGNMQTIDGMTCTWDFKDRLIAVENATMRADYTYDYTDRRITKRVTPKQSVPAVPAGSPSSVSYIDRTYELREDGSPVKYVWNGETRVARVTTNLNATQRLQRFRLQPGWNLCTLAVALTNGGTQLNVAPVQNVYRYDAATQTYATVAANESLPTGTLLRVRASTAGELAVRGTPAVAASVTYPAGRHWIGNATFQPLVLATALPADAPLWFFDATTQAWRYRLPSTLGTASDTPARLEPGEAIFALHTATFTLAPADPTLEVRYYHQDHLGSSSVMTDATGQLVSETAFYPFGSPRQEHKPRSTKEAYGFTQKEKDEESGLASFDIRYCAFGLDRFSSCDPIILSFDHAQNPQMANSYAYCSNNPLKYNDPSGCYANQAMSNETLGGSGEDDRIRAVETYTGAIADLFSAGKAIFKMTPPETATGLMAAIDTTHNLASAVAGYSAKIVILNLDITEENRDKSFKATNEALSYVNPMKQLGIVARAFSEAFGADKKNAKMIGAAVSGLAGIAKEGMSIVDKKEIKTAKDHIDAVTSIYKIGKTAYETASEMDKSIHDQDVKP